MTSYSQSHWPSWDHGTSTDPYSAYQQLPEYPVYLAESMEAAYRSQQQHLTRHQQLSRITESKPRLSKEEVNILEAEFQKNHKPSTNTKKALAESMRVDNARINNWFQNRRAREKKEKNIREYEARQKSEIERGDVKGAKLAAIARTRDLVASTAPFPGSQVAIKRETSECTLSSYLPTDNDSIASDSTPPLSRSASFDCYASDPSNTKLGLTPISPDTDMSVTGYDGGYFSTSNYKSLFDAHSMHRPDVSNEDNMSSFSSMSAAPKHMSRRPPLLSLTGSNSFPSAVPKTTMHLKTLPDYGMSVQRVSSNGLPGSGSSPDINSNMMPLDSDPLMYLNRSPYANVCNVSVAPPTPETPLGAGQTNSADCMNKMPQGQHFGLMPSTIGTPPTTPGLEDVLGGVSNCDGDAMGTFSRQLEDHNLSTASRDYFGHSSLGPSTMRSPNSNDNTTSSSNLAPSYFGVPANHMDYNWSEASHSGQSSPSFGQDPSFLAATSSFAC